MHFYFLGHATWLVESQFPNQGLNPDYGSESLESSPLGHQGVPCLFESFTGARTLVVVCRLSCSTTCGILVLQPGIKHTLCIERWILNYWTTREVSCIFNCHVILGVSIKTE